ncbi:MAG: acyl-CoA dehydrogenase family protein [Caulobacterales bacterium]
MNFELDESQALFKSTVERFAGTFEIASRHRQRALSGGFDRARWRELADLGLIAVAAAEKDGGLGGADLDCAVVAQALGYGVALEPWLECAYFPAQLLYGAPCMADLIRGETLPAIAFAEQDSRYGFEPRSVTARRNGNNFTISGEKHFVLGGGAADAFVVTATCEGETELFLIPRESPGLAVRPYAVIDGGLAAVLTLHDVSAPKATRIAGGAGRLRSAVAGVMLMAAAEMVGLAHRLFDETLAYVKTREQFGQPIGRFQVIQHRMVDSYAACDQMQSALWRMALESAARDPADAAGAKAFIAERAIALGLDAVQLHGGMGMTDELVIGHALKRILLLSKMFGDPAQGFAKFAKVA